jgi:hypothetical protein
LCVYKNYKNSAIQLQDKCIKERNIIEKKGKSREKKTKDGKDRRKTVENKNDPDSRRDSWTENKKQKTK